MTILIPQILEYSSRQQYTQPFPSKINSKGNVFIFYKEGNKVFIEDADSVYVDRDAYTIIRGGKVISVPIDNVLNVEIDAHTPIELDPHKYTFYPYKILSSNC